MSGAWGSGSWGSGSWGGGPGIGSIDFLDAVAIRENVVRMEFDEAVYLSNLLDFEDASKVSRWQVAAVPTTIGASGDAARPVSVIRVELAGEADGVSDVDFGRFVNLYLDRPMTPFPAQYDVSWTDVYALDLGSSSTGSRRILAAYRVLAPPSIDAPRPARDFANPQTEAAFASRRSGPAVLGTFVVGTDGDYAADEGLESLKKRVIRRLVTATNAFAHLPGYGVGIPEHAKRLGIAAVITQLAAEAEAQILQEPDVSRARVIGVLDAKNPGIVVFRVMVQPLVGSALQMDVPFKRAA